MPTRAITMSGRDLIASPFGTFALIATNAVAWWDSLTVGGVVSGLTLVAGAVFLIMGKLTEQRVKDYVATENAKIQVENARRSAFEEAERGKMKVQQEWEQVNAGSLKRQIEEFRKQSEGSTAEWIRKLEESNDDNKKIRASLHDLRDQAHVVALAHAAEMQDMKAAHAEERARYQRELETTNRELHEIRELYTSLLRGVNTVGRKVDAASDNVQVLADQVRSGDAIPVVKMPGGGGPT